MYVHPTLAATLLAGTTLWIGAPAAFACNEAGHDWMGQLAAKHGTAWAQIPLSKVLLPGSHDAGSSGKPTGSAKAALGLLVKNTTSWAQTQTHSVLGQLCRGSRWFDLRFKHHKGIWKIFHNFYLFARGEEVLGQVAKFARDPAHKHEVIFLRLKLSGAPEATAAFLTRWRKVLGKSIVRRVEGKLLGQMTMSDFGATGQASGARIVLMPYDKELEVPEALNGYVFPYPEHQAGTFSNRIPLKAVTTGQQASLAAFKQGGGAKAFGLWWTSTGGAKALNVKRNTMAMWPVAKPSPSSPLEAFIKANQCEVGSFLLVDFYGNNEVTRTQSNLILELAQSATEAALAGKPWGLCGTK